MGRKAEEQVNYLHKIRGFFCRERDRLGAYINRNWKDTHRPVYWMAMAVLCLISGTSCLTVFPSEAAGFVFGAVLAFLSGSLFFWLAGRLIIFLRKFQAKHLLGIGGLLLVWGGLGMAGGSGNDPAGGFLLGSCLAAALILFIQALWAFFHNKVHTPTVALTGLISGILFAGFVLLLAGDGFTDTYVTEYLALNGRKESPEGVSGFEHEPEHGAYTAEVLEYSPVKEVELQSETVDLSYCAVNLRGPKGFYRQKLLGYDVAEAPVAGRVWYPKEASDCPVFFFAHGNHGITTESYRGYDYLGEYLASHGYVVVSVDENVLNSLSNENDARAILLLENIRKLQQYNREEGNPLYGKMDYDNIAIGGHSRGGEMAATAYLFNGYDRYPENGNHRFYYGFQIKGVVAVAPSVDQYMPAGHSVELEDVNYLLLQGANDQDINVFQGNEQYEQIRFTGDGDFIKSSLYISNANHGQFNSLWGNTDLAAPISWFLNVKNFMPMEEQQKILKLYTKVFLDRVLKGEDTYASLLTDYEAYRSYLPKAVYIQQYDTAGGQMICDYEEDSDLLTAGAENVTVNAVHMRRWREEMLYYSNESDTSERDNHALRLTWRDTTEAAYTLRFQQAVSLEGRGVAFDICDMDTEKVEEKAYEDLRPSLRLRDSDGKEAEVSVKDVATLYPPLPVKLGKLQYLSGSTEYKRQFQTVYLSGERFLKQCPTLDLSQIEQIQLTFGDMETGDVSIDNIRLMREE